MPNKFITVGVALLILPLSGCSTEKRDAEIAVRKELTDPASAQFQNVVAKGEYVCGEVNSKNKMGGYIGFRHFYVDGRGKGAAVVDPREWASPAVIEMFGSLLGPRTDTNMFEAVYFKVCA
jgi:hypothetical protein